MLKKIINLAFIIPLIAFSCSKRFNHFVGSWALGKDENVEFTISENNKIKYFEDDHVYEYIIDKNILKISDSGQFISSYQVLKISNDSLVLRAEKENILRYVKID